MPEEQDEIEDDFGDSLSEEEIGDAIRKALSEDIEVRHRGNIDALVSQQRVKDVVSKIPKKDPEPVAPPREIENESAKEFFRKISGNWDKIQSILVEENDDTRSAMDALRQVGETPRAAPPRNQAHRDAMDPLERMVYEEAARSLLDVNDEDESPLPDDAAWLKDTKQSDRETTE